MSEQERNKAYLELMIILPMVCIVLERDLRFIQQGQFKLKEPYEEIIMTAQRHIAEDLKKVKAYLVKHHLRVEKHRADELFTEYYFYEGAHLVIRRYSNIRLRNECMRLLKKYFFLCESILIDL